MHVNRLYKTVLTLFLVSLRLNIKLLYLFLYLFSVSLYKWKSSLSVFLATSEAFSTETFKSDSFNLQCRKPHIFGTLVCKALEYIGKCTFYHLHDYNSYSGNAYLWIRISLRDSRTLRLISSIDAGFFEDGVLLLVSSFMWTPLKTEWQNIMSSMYWMSNVMRWIQKDDEILKIRRRVNNTQMWHACRFLICNKGHWYFLLLNKECKQNPSCRWFIPSKTELTQHRLLTAILWDPTDPLPDLFKIMLNSISKSKNVLTLLTFSVNYVCKYQQCQGFGEVMTKSGCIKF